MQLRSLSPRQAQASWWGLVSPQDRFEFFQYREEEQVELGPGHEIRILRPTVDVELSLSDLQWRTKALVDTGAPHTLFDRGAAEALGLDFSDLRPHDHPTQYRWHLLAGKRRPAVPVDVALQLPPFLDIKWRAEVQFLIEDWNMPFGLLGQEGFLDRWAVTFNRSRNYFVVQEVADFERRLPEDPLQRVRDQENVPWGRRRKH